MTTTNALCEADNCALLLIDIQTGLTATMPQDQPERMMANAEALLDAATVLRIPVLVAEQSPEEYGRTEVRVLKKLSPNTPIIEKMVFSCGSSPEFREALKATQRQQVVIVGQEAHLCVLQTAVELLELGYQVFVAEDAICSRRLTHKLNALDRMCKIGINLTNTESVAFEWVRSADHPQYKKVAAIVR